MTKLDFNLFESVSQIDNLANDVVDFFLRQRKKWEKEIEEYNKTAPRGSKILSFRDVPATYKKITAFIGEYIVDDRKTRRDYERAKEFNKRHRAARGKLPPKPKTGKRKILIKIVYGVPDETDSFSGRIMTLDREKNMFKISLSCETTLEDTIGTLVHELTHLAQKYNGALDHNNDILKISHVEKGEAGETEYEHYSKHHSEQQTEKEAELVAVLFLIKKKMYFDAAKRTDESEYYIKDFSFKEFIKKAYQYGCTKEDLFEFAKALFKRRFISSRHEGKDTLFGGLADMNASLRGKS